MINYFDAILEREKVGGKTETISELWFRRSGFPASYRDLMLELAQGEETIKAKHRYMSIEFALSRFGNKIQRAINADKCTAYILKIFSCWVAEITKAKIQHKILMENTEMKMPLETQNQIDSYYKALALVLSELVKESPKTVLEMQEKLLAQYLLDNGLFLEADEVAAKIGVGKSQFYVVRKRFIEKVRTLALTKIGESL